MHIVHTEADGGKGGQPLRIINESLGMIQRGHQVTILCPETAPLHALARDAGLTVVTMPLKRKNLKNLQLLRRWLRTTVNRLMSSIAITLPIPGWWRWRT
jgi:hypothetical protein